MILKIKYIWVWNNKFNNTLKKKILKIKIILYRKKNKIIVKKKNMNIAYKNNKINQKENYLNL